ncbi:MAG: substrate-binding domain-containing protein [Actinomycetes bacterium]
MKRLAAVILAIAMVVVAVKFRGRMDDQAATTAADQATANGVLVCASELRAVCDTLARTHRDIHIRIEEAQVTLTRLASPEFDSATMSGEGRIDAWLVPEPWPQMVAEQRLRSGSGVGVLQPPSAVLARSPLVIAMWNDRRDALQRRCENGTITWKCIGREAGTPWGSESPVNSWGSVKPGHPVPDQTAEGLLVLGEASASWFGTSSYASNDFDNAAFRAWFDHLERAIPVFPVPPRTPLDEMLFAGPAAFDLTGTLESTAAPQIETSRDNARLSILYPEPLTTADVVVTPVTGSQSGDRFMKLVKSQEGAQALAQAGWRVEGQPLAPGIPDVPVLGAESNVPRAGVLQALRALWTEVIR